jgi:hypothetical protein
MFMRLGILADIHEELPFLRWSLEFFPSLGVDRIIVLGDIHCLGKHLAETVALLAAANATGVWGNHDFGLCRDVPPRLRDRYAGPVLDYMGALQPRLEVADCLFSHVEPWLDPESVEDLWYFDGPPDTPEKATRSFAAVPHQHLFVGHYHRWLMATPSGMLAWQGEGPVVLSPGRFLVAVGAVCAGQCAVFDTETRVLLPCDLRA